MGRFDYGAATISANAPAAHVLYTRLMILYAITSRVLLGASEAEHAERLTKLTESWAANGIDFIQIRENDLSVGDVIRLVSRIVLGVRRSGGSTKVLVNASPENAVAIVRQTGADGVHLRGGLTAARLAEVISRIRRELPDDPAISVSCHSVRDVEAARAAGATLALLGPIFEKVLPGSSAIGGRGLEFLGEVCRAARLPAREAPLPVLALGGVTLQNAAQCIAAGADGIAAIRLFLNAEDATRDWRQLAGRRVHSQ